MAELGGWLHNLGTRHRFVCTFGSALLVTKDMPFLMTEDISILASADRELTKLDWLQIAYTAPGRMEVGSTAPVDFALGGNKRLAE